MQESPLFDEFDAVSAKAWKQKIQYGLKGADYNEALVWESPEGIKVKPFYHQDTLRETLANRDAPSTAWKIGGVHVVGDVGKSNQKALQLLQGGAESLVFILPAAGMDFKALLSGIDLRSVPLHFDFRFLSDEAIGALLDTVGKRKGDLHLHIDPIAHLARSGNWYASMGSDLAILNEIPQMLPKDFSGSMLSVDMGLYQNAGATMVQQLAYGLAHAHEYLCRTAQNPFPGLLFKVAVGGNYFFEIAKLKALRSLWESLAGEYGVPTDCHILAMPSRRNKTVYAYNTNMLRTTTECISAILGSADTLCNLPYDALYHKNNAFGDRIARNQLLLLKYESFLDGGTDVTQGTYYIEELTRQLAEKALELFKTLEAAGGFLSQLKTHAIQRKIKESADREQGRFDQSTEVLVGTNQFVHEDERMKDHLERYPFMKTKVRKTLIAPILPKRLAEGTEQERLKAEG